MGEQRRRRSSITIAASVVMLPVLYFLSAGPFVWLYSHKVFSDEVFFRVATTVYYPITWGEQEHEGFRDLLHWYISFWE